MDKLNLQLKSDSSIKNDINNQLTSPISQNRDQIMKEAMDLLNNQQKKTISPNIDQ